MIREMERRDWKRVSEIYTRGVEKGAATFETTCPHMRMGIGGIRVL